MKRVLIPNEPEREPCGSPTHTRIKGTRSAGLTHAFVAGEKVFIYRMAIRSRPFIEGAATIIEPVPQTTGLYRVRFDGERRQLERLVHGGAWQSDPDGLLGALLAHWRSTINPEIFDDFSANISGPDPEHRQRCCRPVESNHDKRAPTLLTAGPRNRTR